MRGRTALAVAAILGVLALAVAVPAFAISTPRRSAGVVTYVVSGGGKGIKPNFGPFTFEGTVAVGDKVYTGSFSGPGGSYDGLIWPFAVSGSNDRQTLSGTCSLHNEDVVNDPEYMVLRYALPCSLAINGNPAVDVTLHIVNPQRGVSSSDGDAITIVTTYTGFG